MKVREFGSCKEVSGVQYALSLYTLAESAHATSILELGAGWGWSARAFAMSLENRPGGRLVSVDQEPQRIHNANRKYIIDSGIDWDIIEGNSAMVEVDGNFDIIYIDANPDMAQADFLRFYPKLKPGGFMILDGYGGQIGPTEAVDSLSPSYPFMSLPYNYPYCHAVHRKLKELVSKDGNKVTCDNCSVGEFYKDWRTADTAAWSHARQQHHKVVVSIVPRSLSYAVFPIGKGAS